MLLTNFDYDTDRAGQWNGSWSLCKLSPNHLSTSTSAKTLYLEWDPNRILNRKKNTIFISPYLHFLRETLRGEIARLQGDLETAMEQEIECEAENQALSRRLANAESERDTWKSRCEASQAQALALGQDVERLQAALELAQEKLTKSDTRVRDLEIGNDQLENSLRCVSLILNPLLSNYCFIFWGSFGIDIELKCIAAKRSARTLGRKPVEGIQEMEGNLG